MDPNQVLTAVSSLLAAVVGAGAVLLAQRSLQRQEAASSAEDRINAAVQEILVRALSMDLQAHQLALLARDVSSLSGLAGRALRASAPLDLQKVFHGLNVEAEALHRASAHLWMNADQKLVTLSNEVVLKAADLIDAHNARPARKTLAGWAAVALDGVRLGDPKRIGSARRELAAARADLVSHTRAVYGLPEVALISGGADAAELPEQKRLN